jgi:hypothetical protein
VGGNVEVDVDIMDFAESPDMVYVKEELFHVFFFGGGGFESVSFVV